MIQRNVHANSYMPSIPSISIGQEYFHAQQVGYVKADAIAAHASFW